MEEVDVDESADLTKCSPVDAGLAQGSPADAGLAKGTALSVSHELKNLKYKSILMPETKSANDLTNLDKYLENEKNQNNNEPWCKLNKTVKLKKLIAYVDVHKVAHEMDDEEAAALIDFFKDCLDRKKLCRVKDVVYDKDAGVVKSVPALSYVKANKHFTLKNLDKRTSTLKSLGTKGLDETLH